MISRFGLGRAAYVYRGGSCVKVRVRPRPQPDAKYTRQGLPSRQQEALAGAIGDGGEQPRAQQLLGGVHWQFDEEEARVRQGQAVRVVLGHDLEAHLLALVVGGPLAAGKLGAAPGKAAVNGKWRGELRWRL